MTTPEDAIYRVKWVAGSGVQVRVFRSRVDAERFAATVRANAIIQVVSERRGARCPAQDFGR